MIATVESTDGAPSPTQSADERVEELKRTVSASRLSCYLSCRLKFYFRYLAELPSKKTPALHLGSSVHSVLKSWNKARWRGEPLSLKALHEEFVKAWADTEDPVEWDGDEEQQMACAWKLIETYIREMHTDINAKRSVSLLLFDGDKTKPAGNVTIPANQEIPSTGQVVECRYLYAFKESGCIYQPVYLGLRDDITSEECTTAQLKYKAEEREVAA